MPDAGEDLEPVPFEPLPPTPSVALTPARQLPLDLLGSDGNARGQTLKDRDQRLPVRFPGREHPQHADIIGTGAPARWGGGGPETEPPPRRRPLPPWAGRRDLNAAYLDGVKQSVKDSSPYRNVAQLPATSRSSNVPPANVSPSATL